jgi:hypothetical protein
MFMRRFVISAIILLNLWPAGLSGSGAQTSLFTAGTPHEAAGLILTAPAGWTIDQSAGLTLLENAADLGPATDGDPSTQAGGAFISLDVLERAALDLPTDVTLESAAVLVAGALELKVESAESAGVVAQHAQILLATDAAGTGGLVTFWLGPKQIYLLVLSTPDLATAKRWLPDWREFLSLIRPAGSLDSFESHLSTFLNMEVIYPNGWQVHEDRRRIGIFEDPTDFFYFQAEQNQPLSGLAIVAIYQILDEIVADGKLPPNPTLQDIYNLNIETVQLDNPLRRESFILGQPGYIIEATGDAGFFYAYTGLADGYVYFITVVSLDQAKLAGFQATFDWMMHNLRRPG